MFGLYRFMKLHLIFLLACDLRAAHKFTSSFENIERQIHSFFTFTVYFANNTWDPITFILAFAYILKHFLSKITNFDKC